MKSFDPAGDKQAHVFVSGFVQGVGFRHFIRENAKRLSITGWARTTQEGTVESIFQGDKKAIEELIEICRKGPFLALVKTVSIDWEEAGEAYSDFRIF